MRILTQNKIDSGTLSYSSQLERYKFSDALGDNALSRWGKWASNTSQWLRVTYSVATKIYYAYLLETNFSDSASVVMQTSNDGFATILSSYPLVKYGSAWIYRNDSGVTAKSFRFLVSDSSVPYLRVSKAYLGGYIELPGIAEYTKSVKSSAKTDKSDSGQLYGYATIQTSTYSVQFDDLDKSDYDAISSWFTTYDKVKPFLFLPYEDSLDEDPPAYVRISDDLEYKQLMTYGVRYSLSVKLEQCF